MEIKIPYLGDGIESATVLSITVKPGDRVEKGQVLLELETDKAIAPLACPAAGTVKSVLVREGDRVNSGVPAVALQSAGAPAAREGGPGPAPEPAPAVLAAPAEYQYQSAAGAPPPASPSLRKTAAELGIDLSRVQGSGPGGRIQTADVRNYLLRLQARLPVFAPSGSPPAGVPYGGQAALAPKPSPAKIDYAKWGPVKRVPFSSIRRRIGERMTESWNQIPHVTQFAEADVTGLEALRQKYKDKFQKKGAPLTLTVFALKAAVDALRKFPRFNASLDLETGELVLKHYYHIGVAVNTDDGLIVPVIKNVDRLSLAEAAKALSGLAEKTRQRTVALSDLQGGSFTLSNLGAFQVGHFAPLINLPDVAILGLARAAERPVYIHKKLVPRQIMPLNLSYDHRVIDGVEGAGFMRAVIETLENFPERMLTGA